MLNGILANEDRKLGCTGQGTTIVCLEQDAASHCFHIEDIHLNTAQPPTLFPQSDTWVEGKPFSQTLDFKAMPNRNDTNMQL